MIQDVLTLMKIKKLSKIIYKATLPYQSRIKDMQNVHAKNGEVYRLGCRDLGPEPGTDLAFTFEDGKFLLYVPEEGKVVVPTITIVMDHFCTVKHLCRGYIGRHHPSNGCWEVKPCKAFSAWQSGLLEIDSPDLTIFNRAKMLTDDLVEVIRMIPADEISAEIGPCSHDPPEYAVRAYEEAQVARRVAQ